MPSKSLDYFGELLVTNVRDEVILRWDKIIDGSQKGETADRVRQTLRSTKDLSRAIASLIPAIVDGALFQLLSTIETNPGVDIIVSADESGHAVSVCDESDGLAGELYGQRGWIAKYSSQRHVEG